MHNLTDREMSRLLARGDVDEVVIHAKHLYVSVDGILLWKWDGMAGGEGLWIEQCVACEGAGCEECE